MNLRRACRVLDKYREVERASGLKAMHKRGQAEVRAGWGRQGGAGGVGQGGGR